MSTVDGLRFNGRTVLVTGVNSGIVRSAFLECARAGARVVLASRDDDEGHEDARANRWREGVHVHRDRHVSARRRAGRRAYKGLDVSTSGRRVQQCGRPTGGGFTGRHHDAGPGVGALGRPDRSVPSHEDRNSRHGGPGRRCHRQDDPQVFLAVKPQQLLLVYNRALASRHNPQPPVSKLRRSAAISRSRHRRASLSLRRGLAHRRSIYAKDGTRSTLADAEQLLSMLDSIPLSGGLTNPLPQLPSTRR